MKGSAPRGVPGRPCKGRPVSIVATKAAALKAEGLGATRKIAKRLKVGRSSVSSLAFGEARLGASQREGVSATPRAGRWQTRSDAFA